MQFTKNFKRTVWGFYSVEADSEAEADSKFEDGDCEMHDNKSYEECEDGWERSS